MAALCHAVAAITVRKLALRDSPEAMVFWFLVLLGLFSGAVAVFDWHALPDRMTWLGAAIIVGSGLYLIHRDSAAVAAVRPPGEIV